MANLANRMARDEGALENIRTLEKRELINARWAVKLHTWRKLRNLISHNVRDISPSESAIIEHMVHQTPATIAHIRQKIEPRRPSLFVEDQKLLGFDRLVTCIQTGASHPLTKKPLRVLRFRQVEDGADMLVLQLLMLLRDVRFYTPVDVRWTSSPEFARLSNRILGFNHPAIRGRGNNELAQSGGYARKADDTLFLVACIELGEANLKREFQCALDVADIASNGDYPSGLKLTPRSTSEQRAGPAVVPIARPEVVLIRLVDGVVLADIALAMGA